MKNEFIEIYSLVTNSAEQDGVSAHFSALLEQFDQHLSKVFQNYLRF